MTILLCSRILWLGIWIDCSGDGFSLLHVVQGLDWEHTNGWLEWLRAEVIRGYCTHVSCIWDRMTQSMGLAMTSDLRPHLVSPCVFGFSKYGSYEGKRPESECSNDQGWSLVICLVWLAFRRHAVSLPVDSIGYNWITKNHSDSKRRELDPFPSQGNIKVTLQKSMRNGRYRCDHFYEKQSFIMCNK